MSGGAVTVSVYFRLLRSNRNYRLLWFAQIISELGDWFCTVAIYSLLLDFTGRAESVGIAFVLQVLPLFFVAPAAGVVNDRLSRKRVMICSDWCCAVIVFCMIFARGPHLVWLIYLLLFLQTIAWTPYEPARNAVIPNVTGPGELIAANTLSSTTWSFNFVVGAALGGLFAAYFGRDAVFIFDALSFVASALLLRRMKFAEPHAEHRPPLRMSDLADFSPVLEGIQYVRSDRRLLATIFVKTGLGVMAANWVLLSIYGERLFPLHRPGLSASNDAMLSMSLLYSCRGIGSVIGPLAGGYWAGHAQNRLRLGILLGFLVAGLGYFGLGIAPTLLAACAVIVFAHAGSSTVWVYSTTLMQLQTDDRFRGRLFSAEFGCSMLMMSISSYFAGFFIDHGAKPQTIAMAVGIALAIPAAAWALALRLWRDDGNASKALIDARPEEP